VYDWLVGEPAHGTDGGDGAVHIEVTDWAWIPDTIQLKKGEPIVLEITGTGLFPHGIWVPELGINVDTFTPEKVGEFFMGCNNPGCGTIDQHNEMSGKIIVVE
jgi:heme/copper-type cytochrome/quinol oxidase subunit 2